VLPLPPELPLPPLLPLPPELPLSPPWSSPPDVVVGAVVVVGGVDLGADVVVPDERFGFVAFFFWGEAGCAAVEVVLAGARRTSVPMGVGARPIESREIALAARPTATAMARPTTARMAVRAPVVMA
jgi:hypothetical protein